MSGGGQGRILEGHQIFSNPTVECDVVVVGSGSGGGAAAARLAEGGLDVIVLEEGGHYTNKDYTRSLGDMLTKIYRDAGSSLILGTPSIAFSEGRCIGGSTVMNGGMAWHTPPRVMEAWRWQAGLDFMTEKEMGPYFDYVDRSIHAALQHPDSLSLGNRRFAEAIAALGMKATPNRRNQKDCMGSNICVLGCPDNRRQAVHITYIPRAIAAGARVYSDCRVRRLLTRGRRAVGVAAEVIDRETHKKRHRLTVRAKAVFLAAGAIQTTALLQRNRLCNGSGRLGRNFLCHPNIKMLGIFDEEIYYWKGVHQSHQVHQFLDEGILLASAGVPPGLLALSIPQYGRENLEVMENFNRMFAAGALIEDTTTGYVRALPGDVVIARYDIDDIQLHRIKKAAQMLAEILFTMGATRIITPFATFPEMRSREDIRKLWRYPLRKRDIELMTVHMMGTAAMGDDPSRFVVQPSGETWDVRNLFVGDASLFPTGLGVNPQVTIQALATRIADNILADRRRYGLTAA